MSLCIWFCHVILTKPNLQNYKLCNEKHLIVVESWDRCFRVRGSLDAILEVFTILFASTIYVLISMWAFIRRKFAPQSWKKRDHFPDLDIQIICHLESRTSNALRNCKPALVNSIWPLVNRSRKVEHKADSVLLSLMKNPWS